MKLPFTISLLTALTLSSGAQDAPPPPAWTSADGKTIQADFVRLEEDKTLVVRRNGKEILIPMARLALASREQARKLAAAAAAAAPPPAADAEPAKSFGKQTDPDHQRKLAESMISKKAHLWIWKGSGEAKIDKVENLPKGRVSIKTIDASGTPFSDEDAALLNGCGELGILKISNATLEGLPLEGLPALWELVVGDSLVPPAGLRGLKGNKSLRTANLYRLRHADNTEVVGILATCPNLETLTLNTKGLRGANFQALAKLKALKSINLADSDVGDDELRALVDFSTLEALYLERTNLVGGNLAWLAGLKTVNYLNLTGNQLPEGVPTIAAMRSITRLNLGDQNLTPAGFKSLAASKTITVLELMNTNLNQEHFINMKPLPAFAHLVAAGSSVVIDDAAAKELTRVFPNMQSCNVSARGMGPDGCQSLATLRKLTQLHLHDCDRELAAAVAEIKTLTNVLLTGPAINNAEVARLDPLKTSLTELLLPHTRIDDAVEGALAGFRRLKVLEIVGTDISKDCVARLRKALPGCEIRY